MATLTTKPEPLSPMTVRLYRDRKVAELVAVLAPLASEAERFTDSTWATACAEVTRRRVATAKDLALPGYLVQQVKRCDVPSAETKALVLAALRAMAPVAPVVSIARRTGDGPLVSFLRDSPLSVEYIAGMSAMDWANASSIARVAVPSEAERAAVVERLKAAQESPSGSSVGRTLAEPGNASSTLAPTGPSFQLRLEPAETCPCGEVHNAHECLTRRQAAYQAAIDEARRTLATLTLPCSNCGGSKRVIHADGPYESTSGCGSCGLTGRRLFCFRCYGESTGETCPRCAGRPVTVAFRGYALGTRFDVLTEVG